MNTHENPNVAKWITDALRDELKQRREKQDKIFTWSATVLISIIGGVITLKCREHAYTLSVPFSAVLSLAVVIVALYSVAWVNDNWTLETKASTALQKLSDKIIKRETIPWFSYDKALLALSTAAILAIWLKP